ncbi:hypothetical protein B0T24DRAFT_394563 [Lasiosphaeria ovina]|uniref:Secreted protein n=1 Tax=Lasiosphaeria ovina TaxID=92902 RepID=A0AAE0JWH9_9PEZI|nr:hypothetical protein B0T24DRAFT_394563 [Lasiosphaeria ovina]
MRDALGLLYCSLRFEVTVAASCLTKGREDCWFRGPFRLSRAPATGHGCALSTFRAQSSKKMEDARPCLILAYPNHHLILTTPLHSHY